MEVLFLIFMILAITLSSLRINVIYFNRIASHKLLFIVVLVTLLELAGTGVGAHGSLFQVTTPLSKGLLVFSTCFNETPAIAMYVYNLIISNVTVFCDGTTDDPAAALPHILEFGNLHYTDAFKDMITALKGVAGVYAIIHTASGKMYIGSSMNIGRRLMSHLVYGSCNEHLQSALALYGLSAFTVTLVSEYIRDPALSDGENEANLLKLEQYWLNWLFLLPASLRYNFSLVAGAPMAGRTHSEESKAKTSASMKGQHSGSKNPMYGEKAANSVGVSIFSLDGVLVASLPSRTAAAKWLGCSQPVVSRAIKRGYILKSLYRVVSRS